MKNLPLTIIWLSLLLYDTYFVVAGGNLQSKGSMLSEFVDLSKRYAGVGLFTRSGARTSHCVPKTTFVQKRSLN